MASGKAEKADFDRAPIEGYTQDELAMMTQEEYEAVAEHDDTGSADPAVTAKADDDADDDKDRGLAERTEDASMPHEAKVKEPDDEDDDDEEDPDTDAAAKAVDEAVAEVDAEDAKIADPEDEPLVTYRVVTEPKDWDGLTAAVAKRYDDGEIDTATYSKETQAIAREQAKHENDVAHNDEMWQIEQRSFWKAHPEYNASRARMAALDDAVKFMVANGETEGKTGTQVLRAAHAAVEKDLGVRKTEEAPAPKPAGKPDLKVVKAAKAARAPDLKRVPNTLGGLPAAGDEDTGGDEFAHIDNAEGLDQERKIAQLSASQLEAYLRRSA